MLLKVVALIAALSVFYASKSFASDWDKAGIALTVTEGLRVLSGGQIDVIGSVTGIHRPPDYDHDYPEVSYRHSRHDRVYRNPVLLCDKKIWVPHYEWRKRFVPGTVHYEPGYGKVVEAGHFVRVKVQVGGHWEFSQERCW